MLVQMSTTSIFLLRNVTLVFFDSPPSRSTVLQVQAQSSKSKYNPPSTRAEAHVHSPSVAAVGRDQGIPLVKESLSTKRAVK